MIKKLLVAAFVSAFAFAAYTPAASACGGMDKKVAKEKKKDADKNKKTADKKKQTDKKKKDGKKG